MDGAFGITTRNLDSLFGSSLEPHGVRMYGHRVNFRTSEKANE